jgi:FkbM family methyltransferase
MTDMTTDTLITHRDATYDPRHDMWLRPFTLDLMIAKEAAHYTSQMPCQPGDVLLDVGANIGAVTLAYLRAGAARVIAVEPEPDNLVMLQRNLEPYGDQVTIVAAAVVPSTYEGETASLLVSPGMNRGAHSTVPKKHSVRESVEVPVVRYPTLFRDDVTLLKVDCEGAEYSFADDMVRLTPSHVRALTMELHVSGDVARASGLSLNAELRGAGWGVTHERNSLMSTRTRFCLRTYERGAASIVDDVPREPDSLSADGVRNIQSGMRVALRDGTLGTVVKLAPNKNFALVQFDGEAKTRSRSTRGLVIV